MSIAVDKMHKVRNWLLLGAGPALLMAGAALSFGLDAWMDSVGTAERRVIPQLSHAPEFVFAAAFMISTSVLCVGLVRAFTAWVRRGGSRVYLGMLAAVFGVHLLGVVGAGVGLFNATFCLFGDRLVQESSSPSGQQHAYLYDTGFLCPSFALYTRESWSLIATRIAEIEAECVLLAGNPVPSQQAEILWDDTTESFGLELRPH